MFLDDSHCRRNWKDFINATPFFFTYQPTDIWDTGSAIPSEKLFTKSHILSQFSVINSVLGRIVKVEQDKFINSLCLKR